MLKGLIQGGQKACKRNNIRYEEEQITVARTKEHEEEEEDTGIRSAGTENKVTKIIRPYNYVPTCT